MVDLDPNNFKDIKGKQKALKVLVIWFLFTYIIRLISLDVVGYFYVIVK